MFGDDTLARIEVGDGARDFEDAIVSARGQAHAPDGHFQRSLSSIVQCTQGTQDADGDMRVVKSAGMLDDARSLDFGGDVRRGHAFILATQLLIGNRGNFDMQIDPVEQRSADLGQVALDDPAGTAAFARGIAEIAARTPVQFTTDTRPKFAGPDDALNWGLPRAFRGQRQLRDREPATTSLG